MTHKLPVIRRHLTSHPLPGDELRILCSSKEGCFFLTQSDTCTPLHLNGRSICYHRALNLTVHPSNFENGMSLETPQVRHYLEMPSCSCKQTCEALLYVMAMLYPTSEHDITPHNVPYVCPTPLTWPAQAEIAVTSAPTSPRQVKVHSIPGIQFSLSS